jgi:hypothetical protein
MTFDQMTTEQKEKALTPGNIVKQIGQGNFHSAIILQEDSTDVQIQWEDESIDWVSKKSFGPTWKLINNE